MPEASSQSGQAQVRCWALAMRTGHGRRCARARRTLRAVGVQCVWVAGREAGVGWCAGLGGCLGRARGREECKSDECGPCERFIAAAEFSRGRTPEVCGRAKRLIDGSVYPPSMPQGAVRHACGARRPPLLGERGASSLSAGVIQSAGIRQARRCECDRSEPRAQPGAHHH